jgi:threonine dehydrogenase-like Zn-dependent dehydrogenase
MKVLKLVEPGKLEFEERPLPMPGANEVVLKMKYCGICGSDVSIYQGKHPYASYPRVMGHEICAELGGEFVSVDPYFTCGYCPACTSGKRNCCLGNQTMGVQRDGAYAEYITVPESKIIYNKTFLDPKLLALTEPFSVALHAIRRAGIKPSDRVMIFGAGPIGAYCAFIINNMQAEANIADLYDEKLQTAVKLGAHICYNIKTTTLANGYDCCIDASGSIEAITNCFKYVNAGGKVVLIGHSEDIVPVPHSDIIKKELTIFASRNSVELNEAQVKMKEGVTDLRDGITHIVPFAEVPEFFKTLPNEKVTKALIEF